jgi:RNA polymerase sigma-70 factor, ECF subfamily
MGSQDKPAGGDPVAAIYRRALPQVYGYLLPRCGSVALAEDLTSETFMAAVAAVRRDSAGGLEEVSVAWLVGVARHKLIDHWRRAAREQRSQELAAGPDCPVVDDPWEEWLNASAAHAALGRLSGQQRAALTLRYLDGLPVAEVAGYLGRSVHATETLLVRARAALRRVYQEDSAGQEGSAGREGGGHDD